MSDVARGDRRATRMGLRRSVECLRNLRKPPAEFWMLLLALSFLTARPVRAATAESEETSQGHELLFIPPPVDGVLDVGVYDQGGKLVRVLSKAAALASFKSGLNGLYISWDGNDAKGKPLPSGHYYARGVLVGNVEIHGLAFHLNDFVDEAQQPRLNRVLGCCLLGEDQVATLGQAGDLLIRVARPAANATQFIPLAFAANRIKGNPDALIVLSTQHFEIIRQGAPDPVASRDVPQLLDVDMLSDRIALLAQGGMTYEDSSTALKLPSPPGTPVRVAVLADAVVVGTKDGKLWQMAGSKFLEVDTGAGGELLDLSAGRGDVVWLLLRSEQKTFLKRVDIDGRQISDVDLPADLQTATQVSASRGAETMVLTAAVARGQRVVGLHAEGNQAEQSRWQKWFDQSLVQFAFFDVKDGTVVPSEAKPVPALVTINPANNPLENTRQQNFQLSVYADETGTWAANLDGLPLFQVSQTKQVKQLFWKSDGANGMLVYVSDGNVVEEFQVSRLENLFRFNAGGFD